MSVKIFIFFFFFTSVALLLLPGVLVATLLTPGVDLLLCDAKNVGGRSDLISPVFAFTIAFLTFGAKDGEDADGGVDFFVFSNKLEDPEKAGFLVGGLESINGDRREDLFTPSPPAPLEELKGLLLFVSRLRSLAMFNVFVFFLTNSSSFSSPTIDSLLTLLSLPTTLLFSTIEILFCTTGKLSFAS